MAGTIVIDRIESDSSYSSTINIASTVNFTSLPTIGNQTITFGNRNRVINGSMQIAQRNGTSATAITATQGIMNYHDVDRFATGAQQATITTEQSTDVPSGQGFRFSKKITCTSPSSNTTHRYVEASYHMEGYDANSIGWDYTNPNSYVTCSFWAKSSVAGTYVFQMRNPGEKVISHYYTLAANTWTKVVASFPGDSSAVILNNNLAELTFWFNIDTGTSYTDNSSPANTWFTVTSESNFYKDYSQSWLTNTGATFNITGFQVEAGRVATPFEFRSFAEDLRMCMRYYQKSRPYPTGERASYGNGYPWDSQGELFTSIASDDGAAGFSVEFPVEMRASPTVYTVVPAGTVSTAMQYPVYNASGYGIQTGQGPNSSTRRIVSHTNGQINRAEEFCVVYFVDAEFK
jgi:hypothetical protein